MADWKVPENLPYFEGHFVNHPVLPGVGIIDGSLCTVKAMGHKFSQVEVKKAKFSKVIVPGLEIQVRTTNSGDNLYQVTWAQSKGKDIFAKVELICR